MNSNMRINIHIFIHSHTYTQTISEKINEKENLVNAVEKYKKYVNTNVHDENIQKNKKSIILYTI